MPVHLWEVFGPWSAYCGVWIFRLRPDPIQGEALLDHKELLGRELGREWIL